MSAGSTRTWVIEEQVDPETGTGLGMYDRQDALGLLNDLESVLFTVGGMVAVAAERVKVGQSPAGETLAVSRRLHVTWRAFAPMQEQQADEGDDGGEPAAE